MKVADVQRFDGMRWIHQCDAPAYYESVDSMELAARRIAKARALELRLHDQDEAPIVRARVGTIGGRFKESMTYRVLNSTVAAYDGFVVQILAEDRSTWIVCDSFSRDQAQAYVNHNIDVPSFLAGVQS